MTMFPMVWMALSLFIVFSRLSTYPLPMSDRYLALGIAAASLGYSLALCLIAQPFELLSADLFLIALFSMEMA